MVDVLGAFDFHYNTILKYKSNKSNTPTQTHNTTETVKYLGYIYAKKWIRQHKPFGVMQIHNE